MNNKIYFGNAFSLQMVDEFPVHITVSNVDRAEVYGSNFISIVGHPDTANVLQVPCNRVSVKLHKGDILYVAQLMGGRLPEGATKLPEGYKFTFVKVEILC